MEPKVNEPSDHQSITFAFLVVFVRLVFGTLATRGCRRSLGRSRLSLGGLKCSRECECLMLDM